MIPQEGAPGLRRRPAPTSQVFRDGGLTDVDAEFQEFAMNPRRTPARICVRHVADECEDVRGRRSSNLARLALGPPLRHACAMDSLPPSFVFVVLLFAGWV